MSLYKETDDDSYSFLNVELEKDDKELSHKKRVRKLLEDRLERKRIREEFDELDGEFDWDEWDR